MVPLTYIVAFVWVRTWTWLARLQVKVSHESRFDLHLNIIANLV